MLRKTSDLLRTRVTTYCSNKYDEFKTLYLLFKRESVFKYFFIILILMVISGFLFMYFESDRLIAALPGKDHMAYFDKVVAVMYWAIVTIATCGYGDITPGTTPGRIMAIIVLYLSIGSVSLFSANLASALTTKKIMERLRGRGTAMLQRQKGLFVICGWKKNMEGLVKNILQLNHEITADDIVILADISEEEINKFKLDLSLTKINFVQGEYHNESVLRSVNLTGSKKIMVLADYHGNETETDSRTVMAVITIKAIAPRAYICAEILNSNYENYLKMAMCDEIIHIKEYSRILLANASCSVGIAHIIQDLLDTETDAFLLTEKIPDQFLEKTYGEYRQYIVNNTKDTIIGILENTGTLFDMKRYAIREAQKVADMTKLVTNLNHLKKLEGNKPRLNPAADYIIPKNSMAIFIRQVANGTQGA